jgi:hypothetical protein
VDHTDLTILAVTLLCSVTNHIIRLLVTCLGKHIAGYSFQNERLRDLKENLPPVLKSDLKCDLPKTRFGKSKILILF